MMETIFSDGKTLEIEQKLKITMFLPQPCYFCSEEIQKFGRESRSLCFHSLDDNHSNWDPSNKCPAHIECHLKYHNTGDKNAMKNPEVKAKHLESVRTPEYRANHSERVKGDKNPMKDPEVAAKVSDALTGRTFSEEHKQNLSKSWTEKRRREQSEMIAKINRQRTGDNNHMRRPDQRQRMRDENPMNNPESVAKIWKTRRKRYPPNGMKPKSQAVM